MHYLRAIIPSFSHSSFGKGTLARTFVSALGLVWIHRRFGNTEVSILRGVITSGSYSAYVPRSPSLEKIEEVEARENTGLLRNIVIFDDHNRSSITRSHILSLSIRFLSNRGLRDHSGATTNYTAIQAYREHCHSDTHNIVIRLSFTSHLSELSRI